MREFQYLNRYQKLLTPDIVALLAQIHELKGAQREFVSDKQDMLTQLMNVAKIQSTSASNKIEGIRTTDDRIKRIAMNKTNPKNRNEKEIAGYREVLNTIHQNYLYIPATPNLILQLHKELYQFSGQGIGGMYKMSDNIIEETDEGGKKSVRFLPVPAWETPESMQHLCDDFAAALQDPSCDPLLLIPLFILDFLCIHPFQDGNGRMSRLLTLLLLYRADYLVGKYISVEMLIEQSKETYYEVLKASSQGWQQGENDDLPFVRYLLGVLLKAYRLFENRVCLMQEEGVSKPERISKLIQETLGKITKSEILEKCPDISEVTVQRTLSDLVKSGTIIKIGGGRYTAYTWNQEK